MCFCNSSIVVVIVVVVVVLVVYVIIVLDYHFHVKLFLSFSSWSFSYLFMYIFIVLYRLFPAFPLIISTNNLYIIIFAIKNFMLKMKRKKKERTKLSSGRNQFIKNSTVCNCKENNSGNTKQIKETYCTIISWHSLLLLWLLLNL